MYVLPGGTHRDPSGWKLNGFIPNQCSYVDGGTRDDSSGYCILWKLEFLW